MSKVLALVLLCLATINMSLVRAAVATNPVAASTGTATATTESPVASLPSLNSIPAKISEILTPTQFYLFANGIDLVNDTKCQQDLNETLWSLAAGNLWAIAMYDATAKSAIGIESGLLHQFGHFDECLDQRKYGSLDGSLAEIPVRAKYCLADVTFNALTVHNIVLRNNQAAMNSTVVHWGACVPASCSASDIAIFLSSFLQHHVAVDEKMCQLQANELNINNTMFAYAFVLLFFILLAVLSTIYHAYLICSTTRNDEIPKSALRNETLTMALLSFSIIENTKKLFQASKDQLGLNSINGIKALAMLLILAGHALSFIYGGPVYNVEFMNEQIKLPTFAFLSNSLLFVDTFLLLSGFLFCRILLIELERRRGKINVAILYTARYIRLTPAYMAIIGFYMTWFPSVGSGPLWEQRIVREQERCEASWWLNILYINNYINTDKLCMFQSWYLSVDSQLFWVAPIAIYLLYKSRKNGQRFLAAMVVVTAAIPFIVTFVRKLDPTLMVYADEMNDLASNVFYVGSYIKTHMRASAYVMGLLTGFLVHLMQEKGTKLPKMLVRLTWLFSIMIGVASMYSVCRFYSSPFNHLESTLYAGFHKLGWNLSLSWLVLAATTGHAGWLQQVLSNRCFAPISRLTYCAYLSNGIVEMYHSSSIRTVSKMGYITLFNEIWSHTLDTFILAFFLCLLFESPIHALERILLRKNTRSERSASNKGGLDNQTPSTSEEQIA